MSSILAVLYGLLLLLVISSFLKNKDTIIVSLFSYVFIAVYLSFTLSSRNVFEIHDAVVYMGYFDEYSDFNSIFTGSYSWKGDYFFFFLGYLFKLFSKDSEMYMRTFYFFNAFFYFVVSALILWKCRVSNYIFFMLFVCVSSSFFFLYGNVVRQGLAFSLFLSLIFLLSCRTLSFKIFIIPLVIVAAALSHKAILVLIAPIFFIRFFRKIPKKLMLLGGCLASVLLSKFYEVILSLTGGALLHKLLVYKEALGTSDLMVKFIMSFAFLMIATTLSDRNIMTKVESGVLKIIDYLYYACVSNFFVAILTIPFGKISTRFLLYTDATLLLLLPILILISFKYNKELFGLKFYFVCFFVVLIMFPYSFMFFQHAGIVSVLGEAVF